MKHIVVDLEMNPIRKNNPARKICSMETIEIGAVMLDDNYQEISSFRTYIKPEYNDGIAPKITKLTGITNEMVANAPTFSDGMRMFTNWCLGTGNEVTVYAWSTSDYEQVFQEIVLKDYGISEEERPILDNDWVDFQNEFDSHMGFDRSMSLSQALNLAGIDFEGRQHDALDDARNTAELLIVFTDEELFEATLKKTEDAMRPKSIGTSLGSLIDFSAFAVA